MGRSNKIFKEAGVKNAKGEKRRRLLSVDMQAIKTVSFNQISLKEICKLVESSTRKLISQRYISVMISLMVRQEVASFMKTIMQFRRNQMGGSGE